MNPFSRFINQTEMVSLSSLARSAGWLFVTVFLTVTARGMMLSGDKEVIGFGFQLALAVLGGLGYASTVGAVNTHTVRKTAREYVEAKSKGEALATAEHPALPPVQIQKAGKVEIKTENGATEVEQEEHEWASGDPKAGVL